MLPFPDELRPYIEHEGLPIPLIDAETGNAYMLMPVDFTLNKGYGVRASVAGVRMIAEGDVPTDALAALAVGIQRNFDLLRSWATESLDR